jgi:hypothetical protein
MRPAVELPVPDEEVVFDVADVTLVLALRLRPRRPAGPRPEAVVPGQIQKPRMEDDLTAAAVGDHRALLVIDLMCPARLRGRPAGQEVSAGRSSSVRPHNHHSEFSQASNASSVRQTGVRGNAAEETGGSQSRRAASLAWMLISA